MKVEILEEAGFKWAMLGLSLNKNKRPEDMEKVAIKLGEMDEGHNKFLESIVVWLDITLSRDVWSEFDTYRVGVTKQSQSTMHTLKKTRLCQDHFEDDIPQFQLEFLQDLINSDAEISTIKKQLPEGFLQRRVVCTNYKTLRNIYMQRKNHRLPQWKEFCEHLKTNLKYAVYAGF